jgi:hypothetical protein
MPIPVDVREELFGSKGSLLGVNVLLTVTDRAGVAPIRITPL